MSLLLEAALDTIGSIKEKNVLSIQASGFTLFDQMRQFFIIKLALQSQFNNFPFAPWWSGKVQQVLYLV